MTQDSKDQPMQPEGTIKGSFGYADDADAEGHGIERLTLSDESGIGPERGIRFPTTERPDALGPDGAIRGGRD